MRRGGKPNGNRDGVTDPTNVCLVCDVTANDATWTGNDGAPCDDGLFCNGADTCDGGICSQHAGDPCFAPTECTEQGGGQCCEPRVTTTCFGGDVYWQDSGGNRGELLYACQNASGGCAGGECQCDAGFGGPDCATCVRFVDGVNGNDNGATWDLAKATVQEGIAAAHGVVVADNGIDSCEVWVAGGHYPVYSGHAAHTIAMEEHVHVYGGFAGVETRRDQRDWLTHRTVLDGENAAYHVVTGSDLSTLDGFVVTGGNANGSTPLIVNSLFDRNETSAYGGAIYTVVGAVPILVNCVFRGNLADNGGAIAAETNSDQHVSVRSCSFADNQAATSGGALYTGYQAPFEVVNSVLWGNAPNQIDDSNAACVIAYSDVQGGAAGATNIDQDPMWDPDLRLLAGSPCIDQGEDDWAVPSDRDGRTRFDDPATANCGSAGPACDWIVDMGAYEFGGALVERVEADQGRLYFASYHAALSWDDAENACYHFYKGHLAYLANERPNAFLAALITDETWIGANDQAVESSWEWISGDTYDFTAWGTDQPDGGAAENCATLSLDQTWADRDCADLRPYACSFVP